LKQIGFYTDCYEERHWSIPVNVIDGNLAEQLVLIAESLSQKEDKTPREIELWKKILAPVWDTPEMADGLLLWHEAMVKEGLSKHTQEEFERFVLGPEAGPVSDIGSSSN